MRTRICEALVAAALAIVATAPAHAQNGMSSREATGFQSEDGGLNDRRVNPQWQLTGSELQNRQERNDARKCFETGCIFIRNESTDFDVIGLYINTAKPGQEAVWSPNQIRNSLRPRGVIWTFTNGDASMCGLDFYAVFKSRKKRTTTKERGTLSLCRSPHRDQLLSLYTVPDHRVILDGPGETSDASPPVVTASLGDKH